MFEFDPSKKYQKTTKSRSVIRFQDCDPLKHLNNAKYFDYFFNAREDKVPKLYGMQMSEIYKAFDAIWVVYNHQIAYIKPAGMGEWVKIFSRIIWHNHNSMVVEYFMTDDEETELKTMMWTKLRYVNEKGQSTTHPAKLVEFLSSVSFDDIDYEDIDFDMRVRQLKNEVANSAIKIF
ncbi:MAG: acyl-CoA thioesterase [Reichenbachiella sp.]|uniref:acyl-CoA thioesterase n=1 Tax=Reichenbachiella sp. TaxID=2184521 RepID=UPI003296EEF8